MRKELCGTSCEESVVMSCDKKVSQISTHCLLINSTHIIKFVVKYVVKLKNCWIGTKIGVVVDMDPVIMIVVTKIQKDKKKTKNAK